MLWRNRKKNKLKILKEDRLWVDDNFKWIVAEFGYPTPFGGIVFDKSNFVNTFSSDVLQSKNVLKDFCILLGLDLSKITLVELDVFESNLEVLPKIAYSVNDKNSYSLFVSREIVKYPTILLKELAIELTRLYLIESGVTFETGHDTDFFLYLMATYLDFGPLISIAPKQIAISNSTGDSDWLIGGGMPIPLQSYAIALQLLLSNSNLNGEQEKYGQSYLKELELSLEVLEAYPPKWFDRLEVADFSSFFAIVRSESSITEKISELGYLLSSTSNLGLELDILIEISNLLIRTGEFSKSIKYLKRAERNSEFITEVHNKLAYSYVRIQEYDLCEYHANTAMELGGSVYFTEMVFGLLLFYQGDAHTAKKTFDSVLANSVIIPEKFNYHYAEILRALKFEELSKVYLSKAKDEGDFEALKLSHNKSSNLKKV